MKYIYITFDGLALPLAYKLKQEGCDVTVGVVDDIREYVMEEEVGRAKESEEEKNKRKSQFRGMLELQDANRVVDWMKNIKNPGEYFVLFDENNMYRWADKIRDLGFEGMFPTKQDYLFEVDRDMAKKFVKENYKLYTPEVVEFDTIESGLKFLETTDKFWVLKGKHDSAKTFVPDVNDLNLAKGQITEMLKNFPDKYERLGYILEELIPTIVEFCPEKHYYNGVAISTNLGLENKSFGSGNISVQTGCAEDIAFPTDMEDRINKIAFPPVVDEMARQHKGFFIWDASILVNRRDGKMYFGEFCSNRMGYNASFTQLAQVGSLNDFYEKLVKKQNPFTLGTVAVSVRVFNMNTDEDTHEVSSKITVDYKPEIEKDLWLWDVRKNSRGRLVTVGTDWNLAIITGSGKSIDEAVNRLYKNVDGLAFVGAYYRSKDDFVSLDYPTSILNRLNYGLERGLYKLPFDVMVGEIE